MNTKKIERLVEIKRKAVQVAEAAYAAASMASVRADAERADADRRWLAAMEAEARVGVLGIVYDLEERDQHMRFLRRAIDEAERRYMAARMQETLYREALTDAKTELRRFETWLERAQTTARSETMRRERVAEDELAARKRAVNA